MPAREPVGPAPSSGWPARLGLVCAIGAALVVVWQLRPGLVLSNTTPTGGDLGGHVWGPDFLGTHLLTHLTLSGWTRAWFGGFPAYRFYPVAPALAVAGLAQLVPYGVALKVVIAASLALLPIAVWLAARRSLAEPVPTMMALATLPFLFDDSYFKFGGNVASGVIGEFGFSVALLIGVLAIGAVDALLAAGRRGPLTAALIALTALCHPVVGIFVAATVAFLAVLHASLHGARVLLRLAPAVTVAVLLAAFWYVPFLWYRGELNDLHLPRDGPYPRLLFSLPLWGETLVILLAGIGLVWAVRTRQTLVLAVGCLAVFGAIGVLTVPQQVLTNGRFVGAWQFGRLMLAGVGAGVLISWAGARWRPAAVAVPPGALALMTCVVGVNTGSLPMTRVYYTRTPDGLVSHDRWLFLPSVETSIVPLWVKEGFGGYERSATWPEYHALVDTMRDVGRRDGCGVSYFENDPSGRYGSPYALSLLPYWTDGCVSAAVGIPENMSRNTPFIMLADSELSEFPDRAEGGLPYRTLDVASGARLLSGLGMRYYMVWSPEAKREASGTPGLQQQASSGPWVVYQVADAAPVSTLATTPHLVRGGIGRWTQTAITWFLGGSQVDARPASGGPAAWAGAPTPLPQVHISDVRVTDDGVSFRVDRTGVPVVVNESYFPWWRARGASGPWRIAPDGLVVVPTANTVVLRAAPRLADHIGAALTFIGLILLAGMVMVRRRADGQS